ncbi:hypothetical protein HPB49_026050 [Dermacentor silvarum]|nr:hypothetical protein HPB49_026050 [Dermacentor silvarum]
MSSADARGSDHSYPNTTHGTERAKARSPVPIIQWSIRAALEISPENGRCLTACKKPDVPPHVPCSLLTPRQSPTNIFSTFGRPGKKPKISTSPAAKPCLTEFALTTQLPTQPNMPTDWLEKIGSGIARVDDLTTWEDFKIAFKKTFVGQTSTAEKWKKKQ